MRVELTRTKDSYSIISAWWKERNFPIVKPSILSQYTFLCYNDQDIPVYSMCFYNTDSDLCWIGWQASNPFVEKEDKEGCFDYLFKEIEKYAKELEYDTIFTTSNVGPVVDVLKNNNYKEGDEQVNHYLKTI